MGMKCGRRAGYKNGTAEIDRFLSRTEYDEKGCLIWNGAGYGKKTYGGFYPQGEIKKVRAHAWILHYTLGDAFNEELQVLHTCDVPRCVNPEHLYQGTNTKNVQDRVDRGRSAAGEKNGHSKLTAEQVEEIRWMHSNGVISPYSGKYCKVNAADIAKCFGVSQSCVRRVILGDTWKAP